MTANLLAADYGLVVHGRTRARAEPLAEYGAEVVHSPGEVAEACGVTYLPIRSSASAVPGVEGSQRRDVPSARQVTSGDGTQAVRLVCLLPGRVSLAIVVFAST